jgi:hypothetical protein
MKTRMQIPLIFLTLVLVMMNTGNSRPAKSNPLAMDLKRIRFQIVTVEEKNAQRNIIASALVEGPPGTDFDIDLNGGQFKMKAEFLTDLEADNRLKIRAQLQTRRLYGYSERRLPLYEEDNQNQTLQLGFDEDVILMPFGRGGGDDKLKIEITPMMTDEAVYLPSGKLRPLEINMPVVSPGGLINIQARKIPHRFEVDISLLEDGRTVAESTAKLLLKEKQEVLLEPNEQASSDVLIQPLAVNLSIDDLIQTRPVDDAVINFDVNRLDRQGGKRDIIGQNWSGVAGVGKDCNYNLSTYYLPKAGKKYELRFNIKIAAGELVP